MKKKTKSPKKPKAESMIVIDPQNELSFSNEEELYAHFQPQITEIENFYVEWRRENTKDIPLKDFIKYDKYLEGCLSQPDEVLINSNITDQDIAIYVSKPKKGLYYLAFCYAVDEEPTFIFYHIPTKSEDLLNELRQRSTILFDSATKDVYAGAIEGDALSEGEELAKGHYKAMITLRSESDIPEERFKSYIDLREPSIEYADEIWRHSDSFGQNLVTFIKHHPESESLYYVVVTLEDPMSDSNILLFSFPTLDESLLERYRVGENLQAEEVTQEESH